MNDRCCRLRTGVVDPEQTPTKPESDTIEVDRSFVRDLPADENDKAIADSIISMGKSLGMTIVAEGVETATQAEFLRDHGCDEIQGFFYSKVVTSLGLIALMKDNPECVLVGADVIPMPRAATTVRLEDAAQATELAAA